MNITPKLERFTKSNPWLILKNTLRGGVCVKTCQFQKNTARDYTNIHMNCQETFTKKSDLHEGHQGHRLYILHQNS